MGNTPAKVEPKPAPKQSVPPTQKQAVTPQKPAVTPTQVDKTPANAQNSNPNANKPAAPPLVEEKDNFKFHITDSPSESKEEEFKFFSEPLEVSSEALSSIISIDEDNIFFKPPPIQQVTKQQLDTILHTNEQESVNRSAFDVIKPIRVAVKPVHNVFDDFDSKQDDDIFGDRKVIMGRKPTTLFEEDIFTKEEPKKVKEDLWSRAPADKSITEDRVVVGSDRALKEKERQEEIAKLELAKKKKPYDNKLLENQLNVKPKLKQV